MSSPPPIRIGVSSCLLGEQVRFDGGHKRDAFLVESFGPHIEWVPVCPEVEAGLGVPREAMHLHRVDDEVRLVGTKTGRDHTEALRHQATRRIAALKEGDLCGYVLKKNSPSCGLERVKVYGAGRVPAANGRGLFAAALRAAFPQLPLEEEGRLTDPRLRENFVERVFAYHRLRGLFRERWTPGRLVAFHSAHKLQLLAHSPRRYTELGRLVARVKTVRRSELQDTYTSVFMDALQVMATPRRHVNVLQHILGYFSDRLDPGARRELLELIDDYGRGLLPLVVPLTLVRHHVRQFAIAYLQTQTYLAPHPKELMLRNHV